MAHTQENAKVKYPILDIMLVSGTILLIRVAFPALGFCPNFHDVAPFVQLNIKLLIISPRWGLPHAIFIYSENYSVSLGAQAVNTEESVYILCQMLFIYFEFFFFYFLRHKQDLAVEPRCRSLTAKKRSGASSAS